MNKIIIPIASAILAIPAVGFAQAPPQSAAMVATAPGEVAAADAVQFQGKVKSIDKATRNVVLVGAQGKEFTIPAGPEVKNFDQIKVGDLVTLTYVQALALDLHKSVNGGKLGQPIVKEEAVRAAPGSKPAGAIERTVSLTANITKVDMKTQMVTLKGPNRTVEVKVKDLEMLKKLKVDDQVDATFTEAIAMQVTAAPTK